MSNPQYTNHNDNQSVILLIQLDALVRYTLD